jgi:photosystem II stability/assembly factor-like uncharacterized protein
MASDRTLYIGTHDGLYRATANGDVKEPQLLGLNGKGPVMYPTVDAKDPRRIYAGTVMSGLYRSEDGGKSWKESNDGILFKMIFSLAQNPATGDLFAGTEPASIFKSSDGGESWTDLPGVRQLEDTLHWTFPNAPHNAHVKHIDVSSAAPERILGAVEEGWVIRTTDSGKSWTNVKDHVEFDCHTVTTMPNDPNAVVATSGRGFYRSEDGGASFEPSMDGLTCEYMANVIVHPSHPNVLLTAAAAVPPPFWRRGGSANAGIFRSENQGKSWERLKGGLPEKIDAAPRVVAGDSEDPGAVYIGFTDGTVWASGDAGESFRQIIGNLPPIRSLVVTH